jgi:hypothetical protein
MSSTEFLGPDELADARADRDYEWARQAEELDAQEAAQKAVCDHAGHEWVDAGGGLSICSQCGKERF